MNLVKLGRIWDVCQTFTNFIKYVKLNWQFNEIISNVGWILSNLMIFVELKKFFVDKKWLILNFHQIRQAITNIWWHNYTKLYQMFLEFYQIWIILLNEKKFFVGKKWLNFKFSSNSSSYDKKFDDNLTKLYQMLVEFYQIWIISLNFKSFLLTKKTNFEFSCL